MWISASTAAAQQQKAREEHPRPDFFGYVEWTWGGRGHLERRSSVYCTLRYHQMVSLDLWWESVGWCENKGSSLLPHHAHTGPWEKLKNVLWSARREILYCLVWLFLCAPGPGARSREVALFCLKWHLGARAALFATSVVVNSGCPNLMGEMGLIRFLDAPGDKVSRDAHKGHELLCLEINFVCFMLRFPTAWHLHTICKRLSKNQMTSGFKLFFVCKIYIV